MSAPVSRLVCSGCGYEAPADDPLPFACPEARAGEDVDHVLRRRLDAGRLGSPEELRRLFLDSEPNPFLRYRRLFHGYLTARRRGLGDGDWRELVAELDGAVAAVDGGGFAETPLRPSAELAERLGSGALWIKDETGNVSGTHKARHLMGLMLWLRAMERLAAEPELGARPLAIASCGNAAVAGAVLARATERPIEVFVPPNAARPVVERLSELGARLSTCPRPPDGSGDPCYRRFREAVGLGALPFTCQGPDNGLVIEGAQTLVWEIVSELLRRERRLDRLFVQVGGGALAAACVLGLREAAALGVLRRPPRLHMVQSAAVSPLVRAWERFVAGVAERRLSGGGASEVEHLAELPARAELADRLREELPAEALEEELRRAATHRSGFMQPWEEEPQSIADAIVDDETYDWLEALRGMVETGGFPIALSEERLREGGELGASETGIRVSVSGAAGLAGALELAAVGGPGLDGESVAVVFTGGVPDRDRGAGERAGRGERMAGRPAAAPAGGPTGLG